MPELDTAPDDQLVIWGDNYNIRKHGIFFNYPDVKWWLCDYKATDTVLVIEDALGETLINRFYDTFGSGRSQSISRKLTYVVIKARDDDTYLKLFDSV